MLENISKLLQCSHLLNMLDIACNDHEDEKHKILHNTAIQLGIFQKPLTQTYDCNNNLQFINKNDAQKSIGTAANLQLIQSLNGFNDERLQEFCVTLFETMNTVQEGSDAEKSLKSEVVNLFTLADINKIIKISNEYKEKFMELSAQEPDQMISELDPQVVEVITNALENLGPS